MQVLHGFSPLHFFILRQLLASALICMYSTFNTCRGLGKQCVGRIQQGVVTYPKATAHEYVYTRGGQKRGTIPTLASFTIRGPALATRQRLRARLRNREGELS